MFILKLIFRNTFRHKMRTILTIMGITIALMAFGLLRTVIKAWYSGADASSASRLITRNSISLIFPLPISYREKIRQIEGVKLVSYGTWFGAYYIEEKNFFANMAVEPRSFLELYPEYIIPEDQKQAFFLDRKSCLVGRKTAERYGWKIGDLITLKGMIFPGDWEFVLKAIYKGRDETVDETQFFLRWDYLNESLRKTMPRRADQVGYYMIGVDNPDLALSVARAIDNNFKNSLAETLTETEKAFQLSFIALSEMILTAIQMVSLIVIVIIMAVAANTMAMTVRERIGEYAVLKTLGFGSFRIISLILGESMIIAMTGCAIGMILTFPAVKAFGQAMSNYIPVFNIDTSIYYLYPTASLLIGIVAVIFPACRVIRVSIAEGLRRIG